MWLLGTGTSGRPDSVLNHWAIHLSRPSCQFIFTKVSQQIWSMPLVFFFFTFIKFIVLRELQKFKDYNHQKLYKPNMFSSSIIATNSKHSIHLQETTWLLFSTQSTANTACGQEQYCFDMWNKVMQNQPRNLYTLLKTQVKGMKYYIPMFNRVTMKRVGSAVQNCSFSRGPGLVPSNYIAAHKQL